MKGGKGILVQRNSQYRRMEMQPYGVWESASPSVWQASSSRGRERQEMRPRRLAGDPTGLVWHVRDCGLHLGATGSSEAI